MGNAIGVDGLALGVSLHVRGVASRECESIGNAGGVLGRWRFGRACLRHRVFLMVALPLAGGLGLQCGSDVVTSCGRGTRIQDGVCVAAGEASTASPADLLAPPTVTASPKSGTYVDQVEVVLTATPAAEIRFSLHPESPFDEWEAYSAPIRIEQDTELSFLAFDQEGNSGPIAKESYFVNLSWEKIFERNRDAVVLIAAKSGDKEVAMGSGVVVRQDGVIATNYHVLDTPTVDGYTVRFFDGREANADGVDMGLEDRDLAFLHVPASNLQVAQLGSYESLKVQEEIQHIGHPLGLTWTANTGRVSAKRTAGEVDVLDWVLPDTQIIQHDISSDHGSSGGAILNRKGELVAILFAGFESEDGTNGEFRFAISISYVAEALKLGPRFEAIRSLPESAVCIRIPEMDQMTPVAAGTVLEFPSEFEVTAERTTDPTYDPSYGREVYSEIVCLDVDSKEDADWVLGLILDAKTEDALGAFWFYDRNDDGIADSFAADMNLDDVADDATGVASLTGTTEQPASPPPSEVPSPTPPAAPSALTASGQSTSTIKLRWKDNSSNETSFRVMRKSEGQEQYGYYMVALVDENRTEFVDTGLSAGRRFTYVVCASNSQGDVCSGEASATTDTSPPPPPPNGPPPAPPAAPTGLKASRVTNYGVDLEWQHNSTNFSTNFFVERKGRSGRFEEIGMTYGSKYFWDVEVESGSTYAYRVYARDSFGNSGYSNELTVTVPQ